MYTPQDKNIKALVFQWLKCIFYVLHRIERGDSQVCLIADDDEREWRMLRRLRSRENPEPDLPPYAEDGPPVFEIRSRDWWFKPVGMLVHSWALIERNIDGTATVYFFHDRGLAKNADHRYKYSQLKGRCAVIDSLDFEDDALAECELDFNGFQQLSKRPGPWDGSEPFGTFYDARETEDGVYSKGGHLRRAAGSGVTDPLRCTAWLITCCQVTSSIGVEQATGRNSNITGVAIRVQRRSRGAQPKTTCRARTCISSIAADAWSQGCMDHRKRVTIQLIANSRFVTLLGGFVGHFRWPHLAFDCLRPNACRQDIPSVARLRLIAVTRFCNMEVGYRPQAATHTWLLTAVPSTLAMA